MRMNDLMIRNEKLCCQRLGKFTLSAFTGLKDWSCICNDMTEFFQVLMSMTKNGGSQYEREYLITKKCCTSTIYHSASNIKGAEIKKHEHGRVHYLQTGITEHLSESMKTWLFKSITKLDFTNWVKFGRKTALAIGIRAVLLILLNLAPPFFMPQNWKI